MAPTESSQGKEHRDFREIMTENLRSVSVYNQWETVAHFDALWLSNDTRKEYVTRYCSRRGRSADETEDMLQKDVAKNRETATFYILADVRDKFFPSLSSMTPAWAIHLEMEDGTKVVPKTIKEVDLEPEFVEMFGHRYKRPKFKLAYEVVFAAKTETLVLDFKSPFKMVLSSTDRQCEMKWKDTPPVCLKKINDVCLKKRKIRKDEDYYWL